MAQKIVRDLNKKGSLVISLKDGSVKKPGVKGNVNISSAGKAKFVITEGEKSGIRDVKKETKNEEVFFFRIDPEKVRAYDRINEVMRLAAAGIAILFIINLVNIYQRGVVLKDNVIASAYSGYENLMQGGEQAVKQDFTSAEGSFGSAGANFNQAMSLISFLHMNRDTFFATEKTVTSLQNLLEAGSNISSAGTEFSSGIENLKLLPEIFIKLNESVKEEDRNAQPSLTEILKKDLVSIESAADSIGKADINLQNVSMDVMPVQYRDKLVAAKDKIQKLDGVLASAKEKIPAILELLGDRYPHRYLILLQNDTEARPTGGFIGSIMIVDINDGYITKCEFHDVYDLDGQLQEDIAAPPDIAKITKNWRLRDSNYSPDFTVSAKKAAWFLQKEKGPSVDTVIAINQSIIGDLLAVTGPVYVDGLSEPLDQGNYQTVISYIVESKLSGQDNPKEILKKFIDAFRKKLVSTGERQKIIAALTKALKDKKILLYSNSEDVQNVFDEMGLSGRMNVTKPGEDYLNVAITSIGGNKSDLYMVQSIKHNTLINATGLIIDDVTIKRKHTWDDASLEKIKNILGKFGFRDVPDGIIDILGRGVNKSSVKIYVPKGSKLLETSGIDMGSVSTYSDDDTSKTYFAFEMDVAPDTAKEATISYQLPQNLELIPVDTYRFYAQYQPGINPSYFTKQVFFKPGLKSYKEYPQQFLKYDSGNLYYEGRLVSDVNLSAVVGN
jgi:hypothetical protein